MPKRKAKKEPLAVYTPPPVGPATALTDLADAYIRDHEAPVCGGDRKAFPSMILSMPPVEMEDMEEGCCEMEDD
jgi:hypothetical protein